MTQYFPGYKMRTTSTMGQQRKIPIFKTGQSRLEPKNVRPQDVVIVDGKQGVRTYSEIFKGTRQKGFFNEADVSWTTFRFQEAAKRRAKGDIEGAAGLLDFSDEEYANYLRESDPEWIQKHLPQYWYDYEQIGVAPLPEQVQQATAVNRLQNFLGSSKAKAVQLARQGATIISQAGNIALQHLDPSLTGHRTPTTTIPVSYASSSQQQDDSRLAAQARDSLEKSRIGTTGQDFANDDLAALHAANTVMKALTSNTYQTFAPPPGIKTKAPQSRVAFMQNKLTTYVAATLAELDKDNSEIAKSTAAVQAADQRDDFILGFLQDTLHKNPQTDSTIANGMTIAQWHTHLNRMEQALQKFQHQRARDARQYATRPISTNVQEGDEKQEYPGQRTIVPDVRGPLRRGVPQFADARGQRSVVQRLADLNRQFPMNPEEYRKIRNMHNASSHGPGHIFGNAQQGPVQAYDPEINSFFPRFLPVEEIAMMPHLDAQEILRLQTEMYKNMLDVRRKPTAQLNQRLVAPWSGYNHAKGRNMTIEDYREPHLNNIKDALFLHQVQRDSAAAQAHFTRQGILITAILQARIRGVAIINARRRWTREMNSYQHYRKTGQRNPATGNLIADENRIFAAYSNVNQPYNAAARHAATQERAYTAAAQAQRQAHLVFQNRHNQMDQLLHDYETRRDLRVDRWKRKAKMDNIHRTAHQNIPLAWSNPQSLQSYNEIEHHYTQSMGAKMKPLNKDKQIQMVNEYIDMMDSMIRSQYEDSRLESYIRQQRRSLRKNDALKTRAPIFMKNVLPRVVKLQNDLVQKKLLHESELIQHPAMAHNTKHTGNAPILTLRNIKFEEDHIKNKHLRDDVRGLVEYYGRKLNDDRYRFGVNAPRERQRLHDEVIARIVKLNRDIAQGVQDGHITTHIQYNVPQSFFDIESTLMGMVSTLTQKTTAVHHIVGLFRQYDRNVDIYKRRKDQKWKIHRTSSHLQRSREIRHEGIWVYRDEQNLISERKYGEGNGIIIGMFPKMIEIICKHGRYHNKDLKLLAHILRNEGGILLVVKNNKLVKVRIISPKDDERVVCTILLESLNSTQDTRYVLRRPFHAGGFLASPLSMSKTYNRHFLRN